MDSLIVLRLAYFVSVGLFLPRDALQWKARSCDRMSPVRLSVCLSVCNVDGLWYIYISLFIVKHDSKRKEKVKQLGHKDYNAHTQ